LLFEKLLSLSVIRQIKGFDFSACSCDNNLSSTILSTSEEAALFVVRLSIGFSFAEFRIKLYAPQTPNPQKKR